MYATLKIGHLFCVIVVFFCTCTKSARNVEIEQLPFCDETLGDKSSNSLVFISTLDGKISALDAAQNGQLKWTLDLTNGPMLSSTIHRMELNNDGRWVRLIPSLNGGLYQFDGENLTAMPFNSDNLLQSTFRYTDDLVFAGGKEVHSYGISTLTGEVLYECNINGCINRTNESGQIDQEVLIIQRFQKTVHAIEPRTGVERWNFSVGQHILSMVEGEKLDCHGTDGAQKLEVEFNLKFIVPEGRVWAVNKLNVNDILWQYQFDSPIVSIWRTENSMDPAVPDRLKAVDLFTSQWNWDTDTALKPSIYLGMHEKLLYVQESQALYNMLERSTNTVRDTVKFPWKPFSAIGSVIRPQQEPHQITDREIPQITDERQTTAISVLYGSAYVNGNGFYLYTDDDLYSKEHSQCNTTTSPDVMISEIVEPTFTDYFSEEEDTPVRIIIVSLWYWWKEVVIISITTAMLLNFMLTQRLLNATTPTTDALLPPLIVERHIAPKEENSKSRVDDNGGSDFTSRYLNDFDPINCLGKGGYGVVFKARNKIDDCDYAIKRIALPNSRDSRERVMREVKALAKLDHHNIVRYFNAWLECPPSGWQEDHDRRLIDEHKFPPSEFSMGVSAPTSKCSDSVCIDVPHSNPSSIDSAVEALKLDNLDEDEDSFIVFEKSDAKSVEESDSVVFLAPDNFYDEKNIPNSLNHANVSGDSTTNCSDSSVSDHNSINGALSNTNVINGSDKKRSLSLDVDNKVNRMRQKSTKMYLYIQMQLCQETSLKDWLKDQRTPRDMRRAVHIFHQIVDAVEYVHLQGLIHRDLKPSNIFFAFDDKIKIGDFGLVTAMTAGCDEARTPDDATETNNLENTLHTAQVGTHLYMSPEQMAGQSYDYKVDIYSLGIIFYELLVPFSTEMERIYALQDLRKSVFPKDFSSKHPAEYDLLKMMLDGNPKKRPTTLGIKARPPLVKLECKPDVDRHWHFNLPPLSRHSSVTSSSSGESWGNIS